MSKYSTFKYSQEPYGSLYTRVYKSWTAKWNLFSRVMKSSTLKWNLFISVVKSSTLKWNLYIRGTKTITFRWNLRSFSGIWDVITKSKGITWAKVASTTGKVWGKVTTTQGIGWTKVVSGQVQDQKYLTVSHKYGQLKYGTFKFGDKTLLNTNWNKLTPSLGKTWNKIS